MSTTIAKTLDALLAKVIIQGSRYRAALTDMPGDLHSYWSSNPCREFYGLPEQSAAFFARSCEGLMMYFDCARHIPLPCRLPSRAAESVWRSWLLLDPDGLRSFSLKHFGQEISQAGFYGACTQSQEALANCLVIARKLESLPAASVKLPALFSLDRRLRMPQGLAFINVDDSIGVTTIGADRSYNTAGTLLAWLHSDRIQRNHFFAGIPPSSGNNLPVSTFPDQGFDFPRNLAPRTEIIYRYQRPYCDCY